MYIIDYREVTKSKVIVNDYETDTVIRIILPIALYDTCFLSYYSIPYSIIELTIKNGEGTLNFSRGYYDSSRSFQVTKIKSCKLTNEELLKTNKRIQKVDFEKEFYTAVHGLMAIEEYFIEIKLKDDYFALERALYYGIEKGIKMRNYPKRKHISKLYKNILNLKMELLN